jgi:hypothetical protein
MPFSVCRLLRFGNFVWPATVLASLAVAGFRATPNANRFAFHLKFDFDFDFVPSHTEHAIASFIAIAVYIIPS